MTIKNWILGYFPKIQIRVEIRVEELHFVSWAQIQKISFLWRNFRFRKEVATSQNTLKIAYFVICFFY